MSDEPLNDVKDNFDEVFFPPLLVIMAFPRQKRPRGILCAKVGSDQSSPTLGVEVPIWKGRFLIEIDSSNNLDGPLYNNRA